MEYKGKTAVITGASSGIGLDYAREFAKRGSNLVLVARREDLLKQAASELTKDFGIKVDTIPLDLSTIDAGQKLMDALGKLGVETHILVNNAGFGTSGRLADERRERIQQEVLLNVATLVDLTAATLPSLLAKNSGAIVNIASTAAFQPVPGMAVYAATKAFVLSFTSAVWGEIAGSKVRVLAVCPGATATEFFDVAGAKPFGGLAPVSAVIDATFKALDAKKSRPAVIVGRQNALMAGFSKRLPAKAVIKAAGSMFLPKV
jgi:short-subunit dehydrogenase